MWLIFAYNINHILRILVQASCVHNILLPNITLDACEKNRSGPDLCHSEVIENIPFRMNMMRWCVESLYWTLHFSVLYKQRDAGACSKTPSVVHSSVFEFGTRRSSVWGNPLLRSKKVRRPKMNSSPVREYRRWHQCTRPASRKACPYLHLLEWKRTAWKWWGFLQMKIMLLRLVPLRCIAITKLFMKYLCTCVASRYVQLSILLNTVTNHLPYTYSFGSKHMTWGHMSSSCDGRAVHFEYCHTFLSNFYNYRPDWTSLYCHNYSKLGWFHDFHISHDYLRYATMIIKHIHMRECQRKNTGDIFWSGYVSLHEDLWKRKQSHSAQ